ncbi:hypothetical protein [Streptomyces sp. NPDC088752]|uniref:hypothetical protein n=1 Tax=Streptomyces sp. NPDC088752 TaxID=3154963 RepID=UPI00343BDF9F
MDGPEADRLQLHHAVEHGPEGGVCVVRCVGGAPRAGQFFTTKDLTGTLRLDRIEKYGRPLEFIDPPHSAKVHVSGGPLVQLRYGDVLVAVPEPDEAVLPVWVAPDWRGRLEDCGLRLVGPAGVPAGFPEVLRAHYAARRHQDSPSALIHDPLPDAGAELDRRWDAGAAAARLVSPKGEFYVMPPTPDGHEIGWVRVRDLVGTGLPSRVLAATGRAAFLAISLDGRALGAVTDEEAGRRVVVRENAWDGPRVRD